MDDQGEDYAQLEIEEVARHIQSKLKYSASMSMRLASGLVLRGKRIQLNPPNKREALQLIERQRDPSAGKEPWHDLSQDINRHGFEGSRTLDRSYLFINTPYHIDNTLEPAKQTPAAHNENYMRVVSKLFIMKPTDSQATHLKAYAEFLPTLGKFLLDPISDRQVVVVVYNAYRFEGGFRFEDEQDVTPMKKLTEDVAATLQQVRETKEKQGRQPLPRCVRFVFSDCLNEMEEIPKLESVNIVPMDGGTNEVNIFKIKLQNVEKHGDYDDDDSAGDYKILRPSIWQILCPCASSQSTK